MIVAAACGLALTGCYTQFKHADPEVVYAEEEPAEEPFADPHEGLVLPAPPLAVSVDRPSYWISQGDALIVTIENLGEEPATLEGRGDLPDVYLEEWFEGAWHYATILTDRSPETRGPPTPPILPPQAVTSHVFLLDQWGRYRVGVKQLTGDSNTDMIVRSEPFEVYQ